MVREKGGLHLKEKASKNNRNYINEFKILDKLKKAEIIIDKTYFYGRTNENTRRKAFLLRGDNVIIDEINDNWVKAAYEGNTIPAHGWLKRSDIKLNDEKH